MVRRRSLAVRCACVCSLVLRCRSLTIHPCARPSIAGVSAARAHKGVAAAAGPSGFGDRARHGQQRAGARRGNRCCEPRLLATGEAEQAGDEAARGGFARRTKAVGIDLGTTNSAVALIVDGKPVIAPNAMGKHTTPSVVSWQTAGDPLVGEQALSERASNPENTYSSVKRLIGLTTKEARSAGLKLGAMGVDQGYETVRLKCPAKGFSLSPEQVSAEIIKALIGDAERFLGADVAVSRAVIAVPAYFNEAQCQATEKAGLAAGLEKVKIMREPEAAALAYGLSKKEDELVLVFDLGGGTFDVSVLQVGGGVVEVIATSGDPHLGGDDFDQCIVDWMVAELMAAGAGDPRGDPLVMRNYISEAQRARVRLSNEREVQVAVPAGSDVAPRTLSLSRKKMETLCAEPIGRLLQPIREVAIMADIQLDGDVGRSLAELDEEEEALGGAQQGAAMSLDDVRKARKKQGAARRSAKSKQKASKVQAAAFGVLQKDLQTGKLRAFPQGRPLDQVVMVGGATRMLCVQAQVQAVTGVKFVMTVNPDEAVALGAAVYAGIIDDEVKGMEVMTAWQASVLRMMVRGGKLGAPPAE